MTRDELEAIRARCEAATKGPWFAVNGDEKTGPRIWDQAACAVGGNLSPESEESWTVSTRPGAAGWNTDGGYSSYAIGRPEAEFIAHAREDVPKLLAIAQAALYLSEFEPGPRGPSDTYGDCAFCPSLYAKDEDDNWKKIARHTCNCPWVRLKKALGE